MSVEEYELHIEEMDFGSEQIFVYYNEVFCFSYWYQVYFNAGDYESAYFNAHSAKIYLN